MNLGQFCAKYKIRTQKARAIVADFNLPILCSDYMDDPLHMKCYSLAVSNYNAPLMVAYIWRLQKLHDDQKLLELRNVWQKDGLVDFINLNEIDKIELIEGHDMVKLLDQVSQDSKKHSLILADYVKSVINGASGVNVDHTYVAARLMAHFSAETLLTAPLIVRNCLGKLRNRKYLEGWFTIEDVDDVRITKYHRCL